MKKIMLIGLIILSVFLIYLCNMDRKVYYLSLNGTDGSYPKYVKNYLKAKDVLEIYVDNYSHSNMKITELINDINENKKITKNGKEITLKNALIKADLITLSFSDKDIKKRLDNYKVYDYIDEETKDLDKLLTLIRNDCKEDIILLGFFNSNPDDAAREDIYNYLNKKYKIAAQKHKITYLDLAQVFENKSEFIDENNNLNDTGQNMIASMIINEIDKKMLNS